MSKKLNILQSVAVILMATFFIGMITAISSPVSAASVRPSTAAQHDYICTGVTVTPEEITPGEECTVTASFTYYGVSYRWVSGDESVLVDCPQCGGTGKVRCPYCSGMGSTVIKGGPVPCKAPNGEPRCQPSCDGWDYKCVKCGKIQAVIEGEQTWCGCGSSQYVRDQACACKTGRTDPDRTVPCLQCNGTGYRPGWNCSKCNGNGTYWESKPGTVYPPSNPTSGAVYVEILIDGVVRAAGTYTPVAYKEQKSSEKWEIWSALDIEVTLPGESAGTHNIEARINPEYKSNETDPNNNSKTTILSVQAPVDIQAEFVYPGANYRAGTDVISTWKIYNRNDPSGNGMDITPDSNLKVEFKAINSSTGSVLASQTKSGIIIPHGSSNIVYFKWRVPSHYSGLIKVEININPDDAVDETNITNNKVSALMTVSPQITSDTPDTQFEKHFPSGWHSPSGSETISTSGILTTSVPHNSLTWQEWGWDTESETYILHTYGLKLIPEITPEPDERSPSREWKDAMNLWQMRSGYGFTLLADTAPKKIGELPPPASFTEAQSVRAYFPEFGYDDNIGKYATLERTAANQFEFAPSPYSISEAGTNDYRRLHYTPLWYPDGNYIVRTLTFDCWTPAGMLISEQKVPKIIISGSVYDDRYIGH